MQPGEQENHSLIGLSPLVVQSTVIPERHQGPEEVDGEEGDSECDEPNGLQPAGVVKVIDGTAKAEPARDGGQRCDEQETHHVTKQGALLLTKTWVLQPLEQRPGLPLHSELVVAELTVTGS